MKKVTIDKNRRYPKCGKIKNQIKAGYNRSGTQHCKCEDCGIKYTLETKKHEYLEETKQLALKMYYSGISGRGVGKVLGMNKANVYNWIKKQTTIKNKINNNFEIDYLELDELYWYIGKKSNKIVYIITIVSRNPRQIVGFNVASGFSLNTLLFTPFKEIMLY